MDERFSSIDLVTQCLLDWKRTDKFDKAIRKAVKPGSVVLDAGTGSGILALFAARAGAKKVYSVEFDPYVAKLARQNVINNGYEDVVQVILGDARNIHLPAGEKVDVVIMEMLTTGMVDEFQVWAVNRLHEKGYITKDTKFLPYKNDTYVSLTQTDYMDHGFNMRMVKHFWSFLPKPKIKVLAKPDLLNSVLFDQKNNMQHSSTHVFEIKKKGVLNSIYLNSVTWLDEKIPVEDTLALNGPVSFPLEADLEVRKGDKVELSVEYEFGNGFRNFKVSATKV